jgi:DNA-binding MarR family transcriptional regulator
MPAPLPYLADQLRPVALKLSRQLRRESLRAGLGAQDAQLLGVVRKRPGIGVSELAEIEQVSRPSMSAHVKRLETAGLLARGDSDDGRRAPLELTDAGRAAMRQVRDTRTHWLEERLARLTPAELDALEAALPALNKMVEAA